MNTASALINGSKKCAVGERVCRAMNKDSEPAKSDFAVQEIYGFPSTCKNFQFLQLRNEKFRKRQNQRF